MNHIGLLKTGQKTSVFRSHVKLQLKSMNKGKANFARAKNSLYLLRFTLGQKDLATVHVLAVDKCSAS